MKAWALFAVVTVAVVGIVGLILGIFYATPAEHQAILVSAGIAIAIQFIGFAIVGSVSRENVMAAWGVGMLLRLVVLMLYGFVLVKAMGLPSAAALVSLAAFLFVSTTVEPLFLKK